MGMLFLVACGGGTDGPVTGPQPQPPASVETVLVTPSNLPLLVGQSGQLAATLRDASGRTLSGRQIAWATTDPGIATVSNNGMVVAAAVGTTTITATSEGKTGQS